MENVEHNPKISLMWEMLSLERRKEIHTLIAETLDRFKKSGKLELNKIYPFELTKAFDKEEPNQFVYLKCAVRVNEVNGLVPNSDVPVNAIQMLMEDIDVFKKDGINDWFDHVNRINKKEKDNELFYENNIFTEENAGKNQAQINNAIDDGEVNMPPKNRIESFLKNRFIGENKENDDRVTNEDLFDFYDVHAFKLSNEEYLDVFRLFSKTALNCTADSFIHSGYWGREKSFNHIVQNLKTLQSRFSLCDFWGMKQEHLEDLGFVNWNNTMMLIPFWAFPVILKNSIGKMLHTREGVDFKIIDDSAVIGFTNTFGCVTYGIPIVDISSKK